MENRWYVVRTYAGHENKVKTYLENEVKLASLEERISRVLIPTEKVFEMREGKKRTKSKSILPGYVLIEADLDTQAKHTILNTPSVIAFVPSNESPAPLRPDEIRRILGKVDEVKDVEVLEVPFSVGDPVKVVNGPFNNFSGTVQEVSPEKAKIKVMVSIFGRRTPVELDFLQVEHER